MKKRKKYYKYLQDEKKKLEKFEKEVLFFEKIVRELDDDEQNQNMQKDALQNVATNSDDLVMEDLVDNLENNSMLDGIAATVAGMDKQVKCGHYKLADEALPKRLFDSIKLERSEETHRVHNEAEIKFMKKKLRTISKLKWDDDNTLASAKQKAEENYKILKNTFTVKRKLWIEMTLEERTLLCIWLDEWKDKEALAVDAIHNRCQRRGVVFGLRKRQSERCRAN